VVGAQVRDGEVIGPGTQGQHQPDVVDRAVLGLQRPSGQVEADDLGLDESDPLAHDPLRRDAHLVGGVDARSDLGRSVSVWWSCRSTRVSSTRGCRAAWS
jgi:hypothetical protein